ncbi:bridge-like lipid transfer protein family member 3B isoform X5 [Chironomus tepperi]|uniref:bridge-like lipid transfer protein family member 3B isoform X5 n=1 Tax=Chironomus tepperi TaxID=113505 RepID=UPI00391EE4CC
MVSILKNQLLKHLSRYIKNLSSDKINISTFKGEGELTNLQLDENVLTELLELPSWLKLTSAWCNHISFRISWAKLKSVPITLSLDEVNISVETCELGRSGTPTSNNSTIQSLSVPMGKYSFIHKVIDGITITVNTVNVNFKSPAFTASVQMSRIRVESRTPKWSAAELRFTRLKDPIKGIILIFKELSWQTVRIEASSTQDQNLTPLRLLTNQAKCRITIKKKLSDCSVLASKLLLILDDLLWVLTDSQLKAALHFVDSLAGLIQSSNKTIQRKKAQKKLETLPEYQSFLDQSSNRPPENQANISQAQKMFNLFDVRETSYHFFSQRIDLHLCDDFGSGRSSHPNLKDGGALQISIQGFQVDYYPYHLAKANRAHWAKYKEASVPPLIWLEQSMNSFRESIISLSNPNRPPSHAPLERTPNPTNINGYQSGTSTPTQTASPLKRQVLDNLAKLMTSCVILRIEDFTLYRVTTSGKKSMPKEFVSGDKDRFSFPPEMPTVHAEFTYFYYPGDFVFPLPPSKCFVYLNPIQVQFDVDSCLWFVSFGLNLYESLLRTSVGDSMNSPSSSTEPSLMYMDVKLEAIMPRIIFEATKEVTVVQRDRPKTMQVQVSRFAVTNIRETGSSRADLAQAIHSLQEGSLVFSSGFPSKPDDLSIVTDRILSHIAATDISSTQPNSPNLYSLPSNQMSRYALWNDTRDIWCIKIDPIWIEFLGVRSIGVNKVIPFLDAVPITLWIHGKSEVDDTIAEKMAEREKPQPIPPISKSNEMILSVTSLKTESHINDGSVLFDSVQSIRYSNMQYSDSNCDVNATGAATSDLNMDKKSADLHIIAHFGNLVSLQIDHYQFLFLMRLLEDINEVTTFLTIDSKRIMQEKSPDHSIILGCVIPQVEVTLVMPSQTPGKESSGGDGESVIPDSVSLGDDLHTTNSGWKEQGSFSLDNQSRIMHAFSSIESPSPKEKADYPLETKPNIKFNIPSTGNVASSTATTTNTTVSVSNTTNTASSSSSSSTATLRNKKIIGDSSIIPKELNTGLSQMKKGFSNFMTSIESAVKTNTSFDEGSDTISIQSDYSDDSELFTVLADTDKTTTDCNDFMFKLNPFSSDTNSKLAPIEVASEVCEDPYITNMSSPSEPSDASSLRRRDLVSMATLRLTTVELIRENKGSSSVARVQVSAISLEECESLAWDELQNDQQKKQKVKFGTRCRAWNMATYNPESLPCLALRFEESLNLPDDLGSTVDKKLIPTFFNRQVNLKVTDFKLPSIQMSTIIGLADLTEDEIITPPFPVNIDLENVKINIIEDRPPVNITSPSTPQPINLVIGKMKIIRDSSGVLQIQPIDSNNEFVSENIGDDITSLRRERDRELLSIQLIMQQIKIENDQLRRQLLTAEKNVEVNRQRIKQENEILKTYLKAAQDDVATLLDEKRTLMDTIKSLQNQLTAMEPRDGKR